MTRFPHHVSRVYRAYYNHKVAAPICFISLSAPSITMYAMTLMAQSRPSEEIMIESDREFAEYWTEMHREYYIPLQHGMMVLSLIGLASSLQCLWARWPQFRLKTFSPAHVAFVFPILSHANAVQAYRAGFNAFTTDPPDSLFHIILYSYWLTCLVAGTGLNWIFTYKYLTLLPRWTKLEEICFVSEEENNDNFLDNDKDTSPNPSMLQEWRSSMDDSISHRERVGIPHEIFRQSFTSPAVLHANEVGALMRVRRGTEDYEQYGPYVRTRNVSSLGFDLTLSNNELRQERAELLRWVAKNAPRTRKRTLSIPPMFQWRGGIGGASASSSAVSGEAYGTFPKEEGRHQRSQTWGAWAV